MKPFAFMMLLLGSAAYGADLDFSALKGGARALDFRGKAVVFRAFEDIVYVKNPIDSDYQRMNIYIPEAYFNGATVQGFRADTAPIFLPNAVGGYMPAKAMRPDDAPRESSENSVLAALAQGYVVASPGARGGTQSHGKAPAAIVDLKAAVAYLHANDAHMPGDAQKIIANGTSAGGALAALLGASGDHGDYQALLREAGAAQASTAVFAVSAYCPITNLEHADAAYAWQFAGVRDYAVTRVSRENGQITRHVEAGRLDDEAWAMSQVLAALFPPYVNSLNLKDTSGNALSLDANGVGPFRDYLAAKLAESAQEALQAGTDPQAMHASGWVQLDGNFAGNHVEKIDFAEYSKALKRQKFGFDVAGLSTPENRLFGDAQHDARHFTDVASQHYPDAPRAGAQTVKLMNPMHYLGESPTQHWRIRHGTQDADTSLAVSAILALALENKGKNVDYALPWDVGHRGDYDLDALFAWIKHISE